MAQPPREARIATPSADGRSGARAGVEIEPSSFRDPAGFVFRRDGVLHRQIQPPAADDWAALHATGLYAELVAHRLLIDHQDADASAAARDGAVAVIVPRPLDFISYPYEWCFSQLQEAALLTLDIQARALERGMRLRDASAYNVQFDAGRPILIDSLSFEVAPATDPWPAYRQFCEHFLAPLALMAHRDLRFGLLLRDFIDGLPLDLASRLLPAKSRFNLGLQAHLHLHARAQRRGAATARTDTGRARSISSTGQRALLDSLRRAVTGLKADTHSQWSGYAGATSYSEAATASKERIVREMLVAVGGASAWDLGANIGVYSSIAADAGYRVIAFDQDPSSVELHWRAIRGRERAAHVLPLVMDLTNPSPAIGWALRERRSFLDRAEPDVVMALALIHHLAIGNNVPLPAIAELFAHLAPHAIVEFVPKEDPMTRRLLAARRDIFDSYTIDGFRAAFGEQFEIAREQPVEDSPRTLFLLKRR